VGEALIMTAFGLAVAVPAVLGYNWLVRRNKVAMEMVRGFGADLHAVLLSSATAAAATSPILRIGSPLCCAGIVARGTGEGKAIKRGTGYPAPQFHLR
jgi:hypothetical protein